MVVLHCTVLPSDMLSFDVLFSSERVATFFVYCFAAPSVCIAFVVVWYHVVLATKSPLTPLLFAAGVQRRVLASFVSLV